MNLICLLDFLNLKLFTNKYEKILVVRFYIFCFTEYFMNIKFIVKKKTICKIKFHYVRFETLIASLKDIVIIELNLLYNF